MGIAYSGFCRHCVLFLGYSMWSDLSGLTSRIFSFSDDGIGIPLNDQQILYEPFHRGNNVGEINGTGLGMSIIKRSVEMHNGVIDFKSTENEGTIFTITIPIESGQL